MDAPIEKKVIVIVEDNEAIAELIKDTLNAEPDYQAVAVNDGSLALEVIQSNLIQQAKAPLTSGTGGTSKGDPAAGVGDMTTPGGVKPITTGDRAGAGILTALVAAVVLSGLAWVSLPEKNS